MNQIDIHKVKKNTENMIAIELYRKDNQMKKHKKKKVLWIALICLLSFTGIKTVDALTGGTISNKIKVIFIGENNEQKQFEGKVYKDKNGDIWVKYDKDGQQLDVNESELERNDLGIDVKESKDKNEITIK